MKVKAAVLLLCVTCGAWAQTAGKAEQLFRQGMELFGKGSYADAVEPFRKSKEMYALLPPNKDISAYLSLYIGICYYQLLDYDKALPFFEDAVSDAKNKGFGDVAVSALVYSGNLVIAKNDYGRAFQFYTDGYDIAAELGLSTYYPSIFKGRGDVYIAWGRYEDAVGSYREALDAASAVGDGQIEMYIRDGIARAQFALGDLDAAYAEAGAALDLATAAASPFEGAVLDTFGIIHLYADRLDEAEKAFRGALSFAVREKNTATQARLWIHLGGVRHRAKDFKGAEDAYLQALSLFGGLNRPDDESVCLTNLGGVAYAGGNYGKAKDYFERALEIKEKLRLTATGFDKVRYQAAQYHVYQYLILSQARLGKYRDAFELMEAVNSRYLREELGDAEAAGTDLELPPTGFMPDTDTAVIAFAGTSVGEYAVISFTDKGYGGFVGSAADLTEPVRRWAESFPEFTRKSGVQTEELRGLAITKVESSGADIGGPATDDADPGSYSMYDAIRLYWTALSEPPVSGSREKAVSEMGRLFYRSFILPIEDAIRGKKRLILIPDGYISFLPVDAFVDETGAFIAEKYDVTCLQSLRVGNLLQGRKYKAPKTRGLIVGGAGYGTWMPVAGDSDRGAVVPRDEGLRQAALDILSSHGSLAPVFTALGIGTWGDLPGALLEGKSVHSFFPQATLISGPDVDEQSVKKIFAESGANPFGFIHMALHGIVLPEVPEISALVTTAKPDSGEDGYLTAGEIRDIPLAAEVVVLSACETGLGPLYGGEGVVGLVQSFLQAGANSVCVSLWQVADEATLRFMTGLYSLVREGRGFAEAVAAMKREFIRDPLYRHPFFWAPFAFYGLREE